MLSAESINKTLVRLGQILDVAVEYEHIERNPPRMNPRKRKLKAPRPAPIWLDRAEHIAALLDAAGELDAHARRDRRHIPRRVMLATLVFAGLRIGELLELRWRDVDLGAGSLTVRQSKTSAGVRQIDLLPVLRDVLVMLDRGKPNELVFPTTSGRSHGLSNVRRRVLAPAVTLANERQRTRARFRCPSSPCTSSGTPTRACWWRSASIPARLWITSGTRRSRSGCTGMGCAGTSSRSGRCGS